jgi:iron complex outermembrane receptor protein
VLFELTAPGNLDGDLSDLDPQRAWQFELGTRGSLRERVAWELSLFDIELWDEIRNANVDTGLGFTLPRYENIDRSRHSGVELALDLLLARDLLAPLGHTGGGELRWITAYTWSRFVYVDDAQFGSNELPGVPPHFVTAELRWSHPCGLWLAPGLEAAPLGAFANSENSVEAPSYVLANLRAGFDHARSGLSLFVEGRNLSNEHYVSALVVDSGDGRYFEPGDGRAVYGGVEWRWR